VNTRIARYLSLASVVTLPLLCIAQDVADEITEPEAVEESLEAADPLEAARAKGGDILFMKSGAIMSGVQILKSTPLQYEVQIVSGVPPLTIPRRQVDRVEYDDIDPARDARQAANRPKPQDQIMTNGKELSPELVEKLIKPIPNGAFKYENRDYIQVFTEIGTKAEVTIIVDVSLRKLPVPSRSWTIEITDRMKLMDVLQKYWMTKFKNGKITYELDKIILHDKDVEPAPVPEQPPAGAVTPPPALSFGNRN
jgi:hypothetical protein